MKISNPGQKQGYKKKNYFSIEKGKQSFRILPALGEAAERGTWFKFHEIHFGFYGSDKKMFVFQSPEVRNYQTKMIEVSDAAKERNAMLRAKIEEIKTALKADPNNQALQSSLAKVEEVASKYNSERRFYYNAIDADGNIGLLKLKSREKAAFEAARKRLEEEEGLDPVAIEGAYLTFEKSGDGNQDSTVQVSGTYDSVEVNGKKVRSLRTHKIEPSIYGKLETDAFNLLDLFIKPTAEEVQAMVSDKTGDVISEIRNKYRSFKPSPSVASATTPTASVSHDDEVELDTEDDLPEAKLTAKPAQAPKLGETKTVETPKVTTAAENDQEIDDFLAQMGIE